MRWLGMLDGFRNLKFFDAVIIIISIRDVLSKYYKEVKG